MFDDDTLDAAKAALDDDSIDVEPVEDIEDEGDFDLDEALDIVEQRREERQALMEALKEGFMGLAAAKGWGNRDVEMTSERAEAMAELQSLGIGTDSEAEAKAKMTRAMKCERNGGHSWEEQGTVAINGVEVPRRECEECGEEQLNTTAKL